MIRFTFVLAAFLTCNSCLAGAWGSGSFENDDALDWIEMCLESKGSVLVYSTLQAAAESAVVDATDGARAVAAAEIVAAAKGRPSNELTKEAGDWLKRQPKDNIARLDRLARKALMRVKDPQVSELRQLWGESKAGDWAGKIAELETRLQ